MEKPSRKKRDIPPILPISFKMNGKRELHIFSPQSARTFLMKHPYLRAENPTVYKTIKKFSQGHLIEVDIFNID